MATGTVSLDLGISGIDVDSVVEKLMKVENSKLTSLTTKKTTLTTEEETWRNLNSSLYTLQESVYDLQSLTMFMGRTATTSDDDVLTATSSQGSLVANYSITVGNLAQAQTVASTSQSSATTALGLSGVFSVDGENVTVKTSDTLNDIVSKINSAADSVYASAVQTTSGNYQLLITNRETGTANAAKFASVSGDDVLKTLGVLKSDGTANIIQAAENSSITYNGITVERSTNTVTDAITGVTLTLKKEGTSDLAISEDKDAIVDKVKDLVTNYNAVMDIINENTSYTYDSSTDTSTAGPLFGDSTLSYIQSQLKSYVSQAVSGVSQNYNSLIMVGISSSSGIEGAKSGYLEFDEDTFREALDSNYNDIGKLFGSVGGKGVFSDMYTQMYKWTSSTGMISDKTDTIDSEIDDLNDRIDTMQDYLDGVEERYYTQFTNMELALSKLKTQSSAISSLIDSSSD